jgi:CheY-like chemotaxis protein
MAQQSPPPAGRADSTAQPRRILIVDDNADCREVLAAYLTLRGHRVRIAADAAEALQVAVKFRPEIILLDICMPGTDGHELCARLRQLPTLGAALIYAVTALDREDLTKQGLVGFDGHYTKPLEFDVLAAAIGAAHSR